MDKTSPKWIIGLALIIIAACMCSRSSIPLGLLSMATAPELEIRFSESHYYVTELVWSPDNRHVMFTIEGSEAWDCMDSITYVASADGSQLLRIVGETKYDWGRQDPDPPIPEYRIIRDEPTCPAISGIAHEKSFLEKLLTPSDVKLEKRIDISILDAYQGTHLITWSPDRCYATLRMKDHSQYELFVFEVGSGQVYRLSKVRGWHDVLAWSKDGRYLAYESYRKTLRGFNYDVQWRVYIYDVQTREVRPLVAKGSTANFQWSPDGTQIAFQTLLGKRTDISPTEALYISDPAGLDIQEIIAGVMIEEYSWSRDGRTIAVAIGPYHSDKQIYTIDLESGYRQKLYPRGAASLQQELQKRCHPEH